MTRSNWLRDEVFSSAIDAVPLVPLDFLVFDPEGRVLLGQRNNRPAKGWYFVPGGRIRKNETISAAFQRLTEAELCRLMHVSDARYIGFYEHFYDDSVFDERQSTHYIVNAFELDIDSRLTLPRKQHSSYVWMTVEELMAHDKVHEYTKDYFRDTPYKTRL